MREIAKGKYAEWITDDGLLILKGAARDGLTNKEIAKKIIGISNSTFSEWLVRFPQIVETLKEGRRPVLVDVEDTFYNKKLKGYYVDETTEEVTMSPNGGQTKHKKVTKRWIPPDTTAMLFYMKCRMPDKYNDRININVENDKNGKLNELIEGLREDDIHTEAETANEAMAEE